MERSTVIGAVALALLGSSPAVGAAPWAAADTTPMTSAPATAINRFQLTTSTKYNQGERLRASLALWQDAACSQPMRADDVELPRYAFFTPT